MLQIRCERVRCFAKIAARKIWNPSYELHRLVCSSYCAANPHFGFAYLAQHKARKQTISGVVGTRNRNNCGAKTRFLKICICLRKRPEKFYDV